MILRASLANKDVASENELTVGAFGAQTLGFAITTVVRRTRSFFIANNCIFINIIILPPM